MFKKNKLIQTIKQGHENMGSDQPVIKILTASTEQPQAYTRLLSWKLKLSLCDFNE